MLTSAPSYSQVRTVLQTHVSFKFTTYARTNIRYSPLKKTFYLLCLFSIWHAQARFLSILPIYVLSLIQSRLELDWLYRFIFIVVLGLLRYSFILKGLDAFPTNFS